MPRLCYWRLDDLSLLMYFANDQTFRLHDVLRRLAAPSPLSESGDPRRDLLTAGATLIGLSTTMPGAGSGGISSRAVVLDKLQALLLDPAWIEAKLRHERPSFADCGLPVSWSLQNRFMWSNVH